MAVGTQLAFEQYRDQTKYCTKEPAEMNPITKIFKQQEKRAVRALKSNSFNTIRNLITQEKFTQTIQSKLPKHRRRLYAPIETLSMFVSQALSQDGSCQKVVNESAMSDINRSVSTGGYCRARTRLSEDMVSQLAKAVASHNEQRVKSSWLWKGKKVYLVDGTTLAMPDTPANQDAFPQTSALCQGLGFPICRIVGIVSLSSGSLINAAVSPYHGKGACEQVLLRSLLSTFKCGDVVLADAFYSTYFLIEHMIANGIDIVFAQHGARKRVSNFDTGISLGKADHLITLTKPKKPDWMREEDYDLKADVIKIRELKTGGKILITTMLNPKRYPLKVIGELYKQRWQIEVDLRNIKSTLGLRTLHCKSPQMAIKELWVYFLAYNLIRSIMLASALYCSILPRMLSFKHTLQLLFAYSAIEASSSCLLKLIGKKYIGHRTGRIEPRDIKKRHNDFPLLMKPRNIAREEIKLNGHPKKLK